MTDKLRIGFIGLGIMGSAMCRRLLEAGFTINVYNRTRAKADELVKAGAKYWESPSLLAESSDVVITMVTDDDALREVTLSERGVLQKLAAGKVLLNMSTVSPSMTEQLIAECTQRGVRFVDAPVSGSKPQAESGLLIFLASGEKEIVEVLEPVFATLGSKTVYAGEAGKGTALKLAVNLVLAHLAAALSEGFAFSEAVGLDRTLLLDVLSSAQALNAGYFQGKGKKILSNDFSPQFPLKHMVKDVKLVLGLAELPVTEAICMEMESTVAEGHGDDDVSALGQV